MIEVARAAGDGARTLWLCSASLELLERAARRRARREARLLPRPPPGRAAALERHAADLAAQGVDCLNLHHSEWTQGIVTLLHRFGLQAFAWDVQETRYILAALRQGIDGIYCDRVDRMVATVGEWTVSDADTAECGATAPTVTRSRDGSSGQMRMKTRPIRSSRSIGPKNVESFEYCRLSPSMKYESGGTFSGPNVARLHAVGQVRLVERAAVDVDPAVACPRSSRRAGRRAASRGP